MTNGWLSSRPCNPLKDQDSKVLLEALSRSKEGEALLQWLEYQAMLNHQDLLAPNSPPEDHNKDNLVGKAQMIEKMVRMLLDCKDNAN